MEPKFTKYKKLIELQLEELTADNELGQSAQKTVELDQQVGWKAFTYGRPTIPSHEHSRGVILNQYAPSGHRY